LVTPWGDPVEENGYSWKRSKKSPAKHPDPQQYERRKACRTRLQAQEATGAGDVWYFDGAGCC
jgi:hypothetical protein